MINISTKYSPYTDMTEAKHPHKTPSKHGKSSHGAPVQAHHSTPAHAADHKSAHVPIPAPAPHTPETLHHDHHSAADEKLHIPGRPLTVPAHHTPHPAPHQPEPTHESAPEPVHAAAPAAEQLPYPEPIPDYIDAPQTVTHAESVPPPSLHKIEADSIDVPDEPEDDVPVKRDEPSRQEDFPYEQLVTAAAYKLDALIDMIWVKSKFYAHLLVTKYPYPKWVIIVAVPVLLLSGSVAALFVAPALTSKKEPAKSPALTTNTLLAHQDSSANPGAHTTAPSSSSTPTPSTTPTPTPSPAASPKVVAKSPAATPTTTVKPSPGTGSVSQAAVPQPVGVAGAWNLKFDDEFTSTKIDSTKWAANWFGEGGTLNGVKTYAWNVSVASGTANLKLTGNGGNTSGAAISTNPNGGAKSGYQFKYGYVEARIFFPGSGSTVLNWPVFWTNGQSSNSGEIDIAQGPDALMTNYHDSNGDYGTKTISGSWAGSWHTYGVNWKAGSVQFYWDGKLVNTITSSTVSITSSLQYIVINYGSTSKHPQTGTSVLVDYVRAWQ
jgi:hypothetical protein